MTDIQQARDILAKWRKNAASPLPWAIESDGRDSITVDANHVDIVQFSSREVASWACLDDDDARLIVGIAGNPDLLDAMSQMLESAGYWGDAQPMLSNYANRIAAAIIAADERMSA